MHSGFAWVGWDLMLRAGGSQQLCTGRILAVLHGALGEGSRWHYTATPGTVPAALHSDARGESWQLHAATPVVGSLALAYLFGEIYQEGVGEGNQLLNAVKDNDC